MSLKTKIIAETDFKFLNELCHILSNKLILRNQYLSFLYILFVEQENFSSLSKKYLNKRTSDTLTLNTQKDINDKYISFVYINPIFVFKCFQENMYFENTSVKAEKSFCLFLLERLIHAITHSLGYTHVDTKDKIIMYKKENQIKKKILNII